MLVSMLYSVLNISSDLGSNRSNSSASVYDFYNLERKVLSYKASDPVKHKNDMQYFYGDHEVLVLHTEDRKEIEKHYLHCEKHPGHEKFIPVQSFGLKHLPKGCRSEAFYDLVRSLVHLTVRVCVTPDSHINLMLPKIFIFGSGRIEHVRTFLNNRDNVCPCSKCQVSKHPSGSWGIIRVSTSSQLVADVTGLNSATCRLFYSVVDMYVLRIESCDPSKDSCKLQCVTCDMMLVNKLDKLVDAFTMAWERAFDKHFGDKEAEREKMAVIVSHPHGYYKHISIGKWTFKYEQVNGDMVSTQYIYDTPTCPGSAGAHVLIPDFSDTN